MGLWFFHVLALSESGNLPYLRTGKASSMGCSVVFGLKLYFHVSTLSGNLPYYRPLQRLT